MDILMPKGNEEELLRQAEALGFTEIMFLYGILQKKPLVPKNSAIKCRQGVFITNINEASKAKPDELVFAPSSREFFENNKVTHIILFEDSSQKDSFHQKKSELDEAVCKIAKEKNKTIIFNTQKADDVVWLGRMLQDAKLCRKYKLKTIVASFASTPMRMRAPKDLDAMKRMLKII
jgi:RNase P/RNase MRP subunit p30